MNDSFWLFRSLSVVVIINIIVVLRVNAAGSTDEGPKNSSM